jgi:hypothetical protein
MEGAAAGEGAWDPQTPFLQSLEDTALLLLVLQSKRKMCGKLHEKGAATWGKRYGIKPIHRSSAGVGEQVKGNCMNKGHVQCPLIGVGERGQV